MIRTTLALGLCAAVWACGTAEPGDSDGDNDSDSDADSSEGGSGNDDDGSGGTPSDEGTGGSEPNGSAPTVVSVDIGGKDATSSLVTGIEEEAVIVITFSEPMVKTVTAAAYGSANAGRAHQNLINFDQLADDGDSALRA